MKSSCKCFRCGKLFDYEGTEGICPKCAAFNRPVGSQLDDYNTLRSYATEYREYSANNHEQLHNTYDQKNVHEAVKTYTSVPGNAGTAGTYETTSAHGSASNHRSVGMPGQYQFGTMSSGGRTAVQTRSVIYVIIVILMILFSIIGSIAEK